MEIASRRLLPPKQHKRVKAYPEDPLHCEFYDCTTRFIVRSESRPDIVHLVDLDSEDRGRFECSCEDWTFRNPDWIYTPVPYECKHIFRAKQFILGLARDIQEREKIIEKYRNAPDL
jgi:hypothetical protein